MISIRDSKYSCTSINTNPVEASHSRPTQQDVESNHTPIISTPRKMCYTESVFHLACGHWGQDRFVGEPCVRARPVKRQKPSLPVVAFPNFDCQNLYQHSRRPSCLSKFSSISNSPQSSSIRSDSLNPAEPATISNSSDAARAEAVEWVKSHSSFGQKQQEEEQAEQEEETVYLPCLYVELIGCGNSQEECKRCLDLKRRFRL